MAKDGTQLPEPFAHIDDVWADIEVGLTGLVLDPDFATNHYVYGMYTKPTADGPPKQGHPVVVRYAEAQAAHGNATPKLPYNRIASG